MNDNTKNILIGMVWAGCAVALIVGGLVLIDDHGRELAYEEGSRQSAIKHGSEVYGKCVTETIMDPNLKAGDVYLCFVKATAAEKVELRRLMNSVRPWDKP